MIVATFFSLPKIVFDCIFTSPVVTFFQYWKSHTKNTKYGIVVEMTEPFSLSLHQNQTSSSLTKRQFSFLRPGFNFWSFNYISWLSNHQTTLLCKVPRIWCLRRHSPAWESEPRKAEEKKSKGDREKRNTQTLFGRHCWLSYLIFTVWLFLLFSNDSNVHGPSQVIKGSYKENVKQIWNNKNK